MPKSLIETLQYYNAGRRPTATDRAEVTSVLKGVYTAKVGFAEAFQAIEIFEFVTAKSSEALNTQTGFSKYRSCEYAQLERLLRHVSHVATVSYTLASPTTVPLSDPTPIGGSLTAPITVSAAVSATATPAA